MTFYGHADIWGQAKAVCEVEGGPTYEITLKGEASLVNYKFDRKEIDYGKQVYLCLDVCLPSSVQNGFVLEYYVNIIQHSCQKSTIYKFLVWS